MAAAKTVSTSGARRKRVGQDNNPAAAPVVGRKRGSEQVDTERAAVVAQAADVDLHTFIVCNQSEFQLRAERQIPGGGYQHEWSLKFRDGLRVAEDDAEIEAIEKVLAGEWVDGNVSSKHFQRIGRMAGLGIIKHGLQAPPMDTWEGTADVHRVAIAKAAGLLGDADKITAAIRYEKQSPERKPEREPSALVLAQLEAELAVLRAADGVPATKTAAEVATGAAAPASVAPNEDDPLLGVGSVELASS